MTHKSLCPLSDPRLPLRPLLLPVFFSSLALDFLPKLKTVNQYLRHLPLGAFPGVLTLKTDVWLVSTLRALTLLNSYKHLFLFASLTWLILYYACVCQSSLILRNPMDWSPPGSSVHGIFQAKILEWIAIYYSRVSSLLSDWTHISCVSCIGRWVLYHCAIWEAHFIPYHLPLSQLPLYMYCCLDYFSPQFKLEEVRHFVYFCC